MRHLYGRDEGSDDSHSLHAQLLQEMHRWLALHIIHERVPDVQAENLGYEKEPADSQHY